MRGFDQRRSIVSENSPRVGLRSWALIGPANRARCEPGNWYDPGRTPAILGWRAGDAAASRRARGASAQRPGLPVPWIHIARAPLRAARGEAPDSLASRRD